jgi:hypothetical protein
MNWQGQTERAVRQHEVYAGDDVLIDCTFLNSQRVATEPSSITYRMDSLTSVQNVIAPTSVAPTGSEQTVQIPGSSMQPTRVWYGRELMRVVITAVIPDTNAPSGSITVNRVVALTLICIPVPGG